MSAKETQHMAARWLAQRQGPEWSAAEQAAFEVWLTEPGNKVAYLRIEAAWQRAKRLTVLRQPVRQPMRAGKLPAQNSVWPLLPRAAAGLAIAAMLGAVAWQQLSIPVVDTYVTPLGGHKIIALEDGTRIALNTDTVLRVSKDVGARKVWLDKGEAYFEVMHDAARPFVVIAQGRKVTDLGTKFAVRQDAGNLRVSVVEGLVEVEAKGEKPQSLLKPGDFLSATAETQAVTRKPLNTIRASLGWQQGKLVFDYATLAEAVAEFNRYNSQKLLIADPTTAQLTVVGTFQTRDIAAFIKVTKELFGLEADNRHGQIILSR